MDGWMDGWIGGLLEQSTNGYIEYWMDEWVGLFFGKLPVKYV